MAVDFNPFSKAVFDTLQDKIPSGLAAGIQDLQTDLEKNIRAAVEANLKKLNLVTRDEFEVQKQVLQRTREKLEMLENKLAELEKK